MRFGIDAGLQSKIIQVFNREDHVPVFAPDYVAVFDGELFEVLWLDVAVVLRMWMCKDEWLEIHSLGRAVAEEDVKAKDEEKSSHK